MWQAAVVGDTKRPRFKNAVASMRSSHSGPDPAEQAGARIQRAEASHGGMLAAQYEGVQYNFFFGVDRPSSAAPSMVVPLRRVATDRIRGRRVLLETQIALLPHPNRAPGDAFNRVNVLYGLGGSGKTTIALEVAHYALDRGIRTWWVRADDRAALIAALHAVAFQAGATDDELTHGYPADALWRRLAALDEPWLLVLDNADDADLLAPRNGRLADGTGWLRPPVSDIGLVLITSREGRADKWAPWCRLHLVSPLDTDDGGHVLMDRAPSGGTKRQAEKLAERLGGLPLALDLAGSYLAAAKASVWPDPNVPDTFDRYRIALDEQLADLTRDTSANPEELARRTIASTWEMSLDMLADKGQQYARPLIRLLSCLGSAPIPYMVLLDPALMAQSFLFTGADRSGLAENLRALAGLSLIVLTNSEHLEPELSRVVDLHPLVRETNCHHPDVNDHIDEYFSLVNSALNNATAILVPDTIIDWPRWAVLAPHCSAAIALLQRLMAPDRLQALSASTPALAAARYLWASGLYAAAESELRVILDVRRRLLGEDDSDTLATRHWLALTLRDQGRYQPAETELRGLLELSQHALGKTHIQTLQARHSLASVLYARGRFAAAESEYRGTLELLQETLGETHVQTIRTRHGLALTLRDQNLYEAAESEFRCVVSQYDEVLGDNHPQTLRARYNLSSVLHAEGKYEEAETRYRSVLESQREILGDNHPYTLRTRHNLGLLLRDKGMPAAAEEQLNLVYEIQNRVLGPKHHYTLRTRYSIATVLDHRDPAEAAEQFRSILIAQRQSLGVDHPETRKTEQALRTLDLRA